ncbi:MAG: hypothetical protein ACRYGF_09040 [Janthinobacterium lividum]
MSDYAWKAADEDLVLQSEFTFVRRMGGSAQSLLVRDSNDRLWILKLRSDLQGSNALANDLLGALLLRAMCIPSPDFKIAQINQNFFDNPETWFMLPRGRREQPEAGFHFASRFFPEVNDAVTISFLPSNLCLSPESRRYCLGIFLFDVWSDHADRRQSLFFARDHSMHVTFIDNSHLFGGPDWGGSRYGYRTCGKLLERIAVEEYWDSDATELWVRRMEEVLPAALAEALRLIPPSWHLGSATVLLDKYLERLQRIRSLAVVAVAWALFNGEATTAREEGAARLPILALTNDGEERWFYPYHAYLWELGINAVLPNWPGNDLSPRMAMVASADKERVRSFPFYREAS